VPIADDRRPSDPLRRRARPSPLIGIALLAAAVMAHAFVLASFFAVGRSSSRLVPAPAADERIEVAIVEPPPPPDEAPPPPPPPEPPPPEAPKPRPKPPPSEITPPPPPDPIDTDDPPPPDPKPQRRIVGLNLESTVAGNGGPSFAVGNTRMGRTERVAENPDEAKPLERPKEPPPPNAVATRVPTAAKSVLVRPKPIGGMSEPSYPDLYQAQGLEADVGVRVRIDASGAVVEVEIVSPSQHPEFNESARRTAMAQRFSPATRDGAAIDFTITFTYRFRLVD
jgi:protein TonB